MTRLRRRYGRARPFTGPPPAGAVLTFNTRARADLAARLHAPDCLMLNTVRPKNRGPMKLDRAPDAETIADLNERGFTVKTCKCLRLRSGSGG